MSVRVADVHLRGIRARVYRPATTAPALLLVLLDGDRDDSDGTELCSRTGFVVLAASCIRVRDAMAVLEWAADHTAELGANPGRLLLAGGALAVEVARRAGVNGWPEIQFLEGTNE